MKQQACCCLLPGCVSCFPESGPAKLRKTRRASAGNLGNSTSASSSSCGCFFPDCDRCNPPDAPLVEVAVKCQCFLPSCSQCNGNDLSHLPEPGPKQPGRAIDCHCFLPSCDQCNGNGNASRPRRVPKAGPARVPKLGPRPSHVPVPGPKQPGLRSWAEWAVQPLDADLQNEWTLGSLCTGVGICVMAGQAVSDALARRRSAGRVRHVFQAELDERKRAYLLELLVLQYGPEPNRLPPTTVGQPA